MGFLGRASAVGALVASLTVPAAAQTYSASQADHEVVPPAAGDPDINRRTRPNERPWPCRISASPAVDRILWQLWNHSPTFRRQCEVIGNARVTVMVEIKSPQALFPLRGHTRFFGAGGQLQLARVIVTPSETLTWLAHELEHIVERAEGIDFDDQAAQGGGEVGVRRTGSRQYETVRAAAAGNAAEIEVERGLAAQPPAIVVRK